MLQCFNAVKKLGEKGCVKSQVIEVSKKYFPRFSLSVYSRLDQEQGDRSSGSLFLSAHPRASRNLLDGQVLGPCRAILGLLAHVGTKFGVLGCMLGYLKAMLPHLGAKFGHELFKGNVGVMPGHIKGIFPQQTRNT